jgi:alpha-N-arabinofuranosidase
MDTLNPFVGKHSPVLALLGNGTNIGIKQSGLGVIKGKRYYGYIILSGELKELPLNVKLIIDNDYTIVNQITEISSNYTRFNLLFEAPITSDSVKIEISSSGKGKIKIGTISLMPEDNINGWRADVVKLMKELNSPIYRWPGGNFVSGYFWMDGIGPRDKRPPRKNPAWKGIEHNDVGIHEYMDLMEILNSEAFIAVNTGLGTVEEVSMQVEYCNGSIDTPMGKLRAENGQLDPYNVKWWAVGNEMYGDWQLGHMPLKDYVVKHNRVAEAMLKVDESIKLIGVGSMGEWSESMLKYCSDNMDLISEHIYSQENPDVTLHTKELAKEIKMRADAHRKYRKEIPELNDKDIQIAMDEWNYWYGPYIYGELGVRYHHKDALGVAIGLHEYFRNSDIYFMANYAQTVNVIGAIKTTTISAGYATTGLPLKLYRNHFGTIPINLSGSYGDLDIVAALTKDKKAITISIVNPTNKVENLELDFGKIQIDNKPQLWIIQNDDPEIFNNPYENPDVAIKERQLNIEDNKITVPKYSIVLYHFNLR